MQQNNRRYYERSLVPQKGSLKYPSGRYKMLRVRRKISRGSNKLSKGLSLIPVESTISMSREAFPVIRLISIIQAI